jgi:hypothetical protein
MSHPPSGRAQAQPVMAILAILAIPAISRVSDPDGAGTVQMGRKNVHMNIMGS